MIRPFEQQLVLVTGASRGIGAAIAEAFAREGAMVVVNFRERADAAREVVARCESHGVPAWAVRADVRDPVAVRAMVDEVLALAGRIDVLHLYPPIHDLTEFIPVGFLRLVIRPGQINITQIFQLFYYAFNFALCLFYRNFFRSFFVVLVTSSFL